MDTRLSRGTILLFFIVGSFEKYEEYCVMQVKAYYNNVWLN